MDLGLAGKTAFVAASTGGLGLAIARSLAAEDVAVAVTGRRLEASKRIASELPKAAGIRADLGSDEGIASAVRTAERLLGPIDILVVNGPGPAPGPACALGPDDLEEAFSAIVRPARSLISRLLPGMRERRWGRILAVGSSGVVAPLPNLAVSNIGRAALAAYLKTLAAEVAADGVTVNMLLPGRIATSRVAELDRAAAERQSTTVDEVEQRSRASIPAGRYGDPAEFGAAATFLCSAPASYVTGVALRCDGGLIRSF